MDNYEDWTIEELEAEIMRLSNERAEIKRLQLYLTELRDQRAAEQPYAWPSQIVDVDSADADADAPEEE